MTDRRQACTFEMRPLQPAGERYDVVNLGGALPD
jgi:hypothetical protein